LSISVPEIQDAGDEKGLGRLLRYGHDPKPLVASVVKVVSFDDSTSIVSHVTTSGSKIRLAADE
jgi:hypothetical protein